jgi:hypothetical protein
LDFSPKADRNLESEKTAGSGAAMRSYENYGIDLEGWIDGNVSEILNQS